MSVQQGGMMVSQYFTKVKSIYNEIARLDSGSAISTARKIRMGQGTNFDKVRR